MGLGLDYSFPTQPSLVPMALIPLLCTCLHHFVKNFRKWYRCVEYHDASLPLVTPNSTYHTKEKTLNVLPLKINDQGRASQEEMTMGQKQSSLGGIA